jgi:hypothetical protein
MNSASTSTCLARQSRGTAPPVSARVIGNAGTVNTGAIDDLRALADLAVRENLRFHRSAALVHGRLFPKSVPKIARKGITVSI